MNDTYTELSFSKKNFTRAINLISDLQSFFSINPKPFLGWSLGEPKSKRRRELLWFYARVDFTFEDMLIHTNLLDGGSNNGQWMNTFNFLQKYLFCFDIFSSRKICATSEGSSRCTLFYTRNKIPSRIVWEENSSLYTELRCQISGPTL